MILLSPALGVGKSPAEREDFLRRVGLMDVKWVSMSTPSDWSEQDVVDARAFLDDHSIRAGEFSSFPTEFPSENPEIHRKALEEYHRQLRHAHILGSHCVGFSILCHRDTPDMWSEETWQKSMAAVGELVRFAEQEQVDVAAHPHNMSPLCSVERYEELLRTVDSPRLKVLIDPVNLTWPQMFFRTTELANQIFDVLGDAIASIHVKDITMSSVQRTEREYLSVVHLDEAVPGTGSMDYATILTRLAEFPQDITMRLEHFSWEDTVVGQQHIRYIAREAGVRL